MNKVLGVIKAGGQFQVIIGNEVGKVYEEVVTLLTNDQKRQATEVEGVEIDEDVAQLKGKMDSIKAKNKEKWINRISRMLMNTVYPLVPTMAAVGVFKRSNGIVGLGWCFNGNRWYLYYSCSSERWISLLYAIIDRLFHSKIHEVKSLYCSGNCFQTMVLPAIVTALGEGAEGLTFLGINVPQVSYGNSLFPMLIGTLIAAKFEHFLDRYIPQFLEFYQNYDCCCRNDSYYVSCGGSSVYRSR